MTASTPKANRQPFYQKRATVILFALIIATAALIFAGQTWIQVSSSDQIVHTDRIDVAGGDATNLVTAMTVVSLAAAAALSLAGTWAARIIGMLIAGAGIVNVFAISTVLADPQTAAASVVAEATGMRVIPGEYTVTAAPILTLVLSVLLAAMGILVLFVHRFWKRNRKYDTAAAGPAETESSGGHLDEIDAWDALSAEEDPTLR
ncbi:Trp biosynthesis-associated membrane protein [Micrococcoides hystricis]|uniref:Trp biosynthesis-associated membrane protein n=1 Tax=Micrococcoides hystricis TaxID=1572761 RepID=A0ABV6P710_9MICC